MKTRAAEKHGSQSKARGEARTETRSTARPSSASTKTPPALGNRELVRMARAHGGPGTEPASPMIDPSGTRERAREARARGEDAALQSARDVVSGGGHALPPAVRSEFDQRMNDDFSAVRVHTDEAAAASARAMGASAYTVGHDVVFDRGKFAPETTEGRRLLAHELTHVAQNARASATSDGAVSHPNDASEREADAFEDAVASNDRRPLPHPRAVGRWLQRKASPAQIERAKEEHEKAQRAVYGWLTKDTAATYASRNAKPPDQLTPEQRATDPNVIFDNSMEWISSGLVTVSVLSPTPDDPSKGFDPNVVHLNVGGSVDSAVTLRTTAGAWTETDDKTGVAHTFIVASPADVTNERIRELTRHEVQHAASSGGTPDSDLADEADFAKEPGVSAGIAPMYNGVWLKYQNEFRSYWLESIARPGIQLPKDDGSGQTTEFGGSGNTDKFGSETGPGGELRVHGEKPGDPDTVVPLANEKQTKIANYIFRNYGQELEYVFRKSATFRQKIQALQHAEGVNLVNSLRIARLQNAIHASTAVAYADPLVKGTIGTLDKEDIAAALGALDRTDIAFLTSSSAQPFWSDARLYLQPTVFTWVHDYVFSGKKTAPP